MEEQKEGSQKSNNKSQESNEKDTASNLGSLANNNETTKPGVKQDQSFPNKGDNFSYFDTFLNNYTIHNNYDNLSNYLSSDLNRLYNIDTLKLNAYSILPDSTLDKQLKLADEINDLRKKLKKSVEDLKAAKADHEADLIAAREGLMKVVEQTRKDLASKEVISHIMTRISEEGRKKLLSSEDFLKLFKNSTKYDTVVVSIDIRRSTELMLKARTPELFSKFITELSFKLSQVIISNYGIFDKFTGDGILAFFPKFYSGEQAIIRAIKATNECHIIFKEHYENSKNSFNVFIKDVGLGIGIDYGSVTLVNTQSELTVVGVPVVYACRFSGAKAGETLLNQPAKEEVMKQCPHLAYFQESEISIKNEGIALGYNVTLNETAFNIQNPDWDALIETYRVN